MIAPLLQIGLLFTMVEISPEKIRYGVCVEVDLYQVSYYLYTLNLSDYSCIMSIKLTHSVDPKENYPEPDKVPELLLNHIINGYYLTIENLNEDLFVIVRTSYAYMNLSKSTYLYAEKVEEAINEFFKYTYANHMQRLWKTVEISPRMDGLYDLLGFNVDYTKKELKLENVIKNDSDGISVGYFTDASYVASLPKEIRDNFYLKLGVNYAVFTTKSFCNTMEIIKTLLVLHHILISYYNGRRPSVLPDHPCFPEEQFNFELQKKHKLHPCLKHHFESFNYESKYILNGNHDYDQCKTLVSSLLEEKIKCEMNAHCWFDLDPENFSKPQSATFFLYNIIIFTGDQPLPTDLSNIEKNLKIAFYHATHDLMGSYHIGLHNLIILEKLAKIIETKYSMRLVFKQQTEELKKTKLLFDPNIANYYNYMEIDGF